MSFAHHEEGFCQSNPCSNAWKTALELVMWKSVGKGWEGGELGGEGIGRVETRWERDGKGGNTAGEGLKR